MLKRLRVVVVVAVGCLVASTPVAVAGVGVVQQVGAASLVPPIPTPVKQVGDLLIGNHSFEQDLVGWTPSDGHGGLLDAQCVEPARVNTDWASDGTHSVTIGGSPHCQRAGLVSTPVKAVAGQRYTAFAGTRQRQVASLGLRWLAADGTVIARAYSAPSPRGGTAEFAGTAPAGATQVAARQLCADDHRC